MPIRRTNKSEANAIRKLYNEIREWRNEKRSASHDYSFSLLHAPVKYINAPVLIIGERPGANRDRWQQEELRPPRKNFLYFSTHRYAFAAQALFARAERTYHLKFAQGTDMNFFRKNPRKKTDEECREWLTRLLEILSPDRILLNGKLAAQSYHRMMAPGRRMPEINYGDRVCGALVAPHFSRRNDPPEAVWLSIIRKMSNFLPATTEECLRNFE